MVALMKPTDEDGTPFSCSTNLSKEVLNWLRKAKLGGAAWDFCSYLHDQTFGNAGWHRQKKESELWTTFDLAAWGYALGWDRSNLRRVLETLIACHIILFEPGEPGTGKGRIGWNRHFEEWLCYDGRKTKPRKGQEQPLLVISNQASIVILDEKRDVATRKITKDACSDSVKITKHARQNGLEITKDASFESSADVAPPAPKNKTEEYKTEDTDTIVSGAVAPSPLLVAETSAPSSEFLWPPRQEHEKSDLDYYQRVIREREKERVALLARLAHEKLNIPLQGSYGRIGALAKKCGGAGLLVKRILDAAASHIDGDPFDYLTKIVNGQKPAKALASNGSMPTTHATTEDDRAALAASRASKQQGQAQKQRPSYLR